MLVDAVMKPFRDKLSAILISLNRDISKDNTRSGIYFGSNYHTLLANVRDEYPGFDSLDVRERFMRMATWVDGNEVAFDDLPPRNKELFLKYKNQPNVDNYLHKENWPAKSEDEEQCFYLNAYGSCDSIEQLLSLYDFEADPRKFCISFCELWKETHGGWRWHKNGPYVGFQNKQCEYLGDEPEIDVIYSYHVYELND